MRMLAMVKLFVQLGYTVSFVSDNELEQPEYEANLTVAGARVMYGFSATQADLDVHGLSYRFVLLSRPAVAERYMCLVRAKAILADVVYDTVDLHWLRFHRAAEVLGDAQLVEAAEEHRRLEEFAIRSADMVLAISRSEKEKTLAEWPDVTVEVLPNIHQCRPLPKDWSNRKDSVVYRRIRAPTERRCGDVVRHRSAPAYYHPASRRAVQDRRKQTPRLLQDIGVRLSGSSSGT